MLRWHMELKYVRGPLDRQGRLFAPKGTVLRVITLGMLGQNNRSAPTEGGGGRAEHAGYEPASVVFRAPTPAQPGSIDVVWTSDQYAPVQVPSGDVELAWGPGPDHDASVVWCSRAESTTLTRHDIQMVVAAQPGVPVLRVVTESPVVFRRSSCWPVGQVSAGQILDAAVTRWFDDVRWQPIAGARADIPRIFPVDVDVRASLAEDCVITAVRRVTTDRQWQISTDKRSRRPRMETAAEFDLDIAYRGTDAVVGRWFSALLLAASHTSIGRYTPTGAGAIAVTPVA